MERRANPSRFLLQKSSRLKRLLLLQATFAWRMRCRMLAKAEAAVAAALAVEAKATSRAMATA
jgi:hypothetical protein